jgi:hypothetical protein
MRQIQLSIEGETSPNGWLGERRLGGGLHRGIQCVGDDRLRHNFLQRYRSGDRVSANTLHSADDARTACRHGLDEGRRITTFLCPENRVRYPKPAIVRAHCQELPGLPVQTDRKHPSVLILPPLQLPAG